MKRLMVLLVAVGALAACGSAEGSSSVSQPRVVVGTWTDDGFEAHITDDSIEIDIVAGDSHGLYWKGNFPMDRDTAVVVSQADKEALDASILGSGDPTKEFTFHGNKIDFQASMLGVTRTVHLKKA